MRHGWSYGPSLPERQVSAGWRQPRPGCCSVSNASWYSFVLSTLNPLGASPFMHVYPMRIYRSWRADPWWVGLLQALVALNARRLDALWLERMRSAKLEQLRAHIAVLMEDHERGLASRDSAIQVHGFNKRTEQQHRASKA